MRMEEWKMNHSRLVQVQQQVTVTARMRFRGVEKSGLVPHTGPELGQLPGGCNRATRQINSWWSSPPDRSVRPTSLRNYLGTPRSGSIVPGKATTLREFFNSASPPTDACLLLMSVEQTSNVDGSCSMCEIGEPGTARGASLGQPTYSGCSWQH
jgi:hypothetical protein